MATELKKFEEAARELCRLRGANPDEMVMDAHAHHDYLGYCPQWMNAAVEVKRQVELNAVLQLAS